MIKLNHKNKLVEEMANGLMFSNKTKVVEVKDNNDIVFEGSGYRIVTDMWLELVAVWQLDNCPNPIFEV